MADRPTSVSKKIKGLHEDEKALDGKSSLKNAFDPVKEQDIRMLELRPKGPERDGSKMVREDAPASAPRPPARIRQVPDRFAAIRKLEQDRREAEEQNRAAKAWAQFQDKQKRDMSREQDNDKTQYGNPREAEKAEKDKTQETPEQAWERFQERQKELDREQDHGIDRGRERD